MLPPGSSKKYVEYIHKFRFLIVAFWVAMDILGLVYGLKFFGATTTEFVAPPGSDAVVAENHLIHYFPEEDQVRSAVVYIQSRNEASVFDGDLGNSLFQFNRQLEKSLNDSKIFVSYSSYYSFMDDDLPLLAAGFVSNTTDTATYISIRYEGKDREKSMDYIDKITNRVKKIKKDMDLEDVTRMRETGVDYFQKDTLEGTTEDMHTMDTSTCRERNHASSSLLPIASI